MARTATLRQITPEKRQPVFTVRAKDGANPKGWITVGAAWDFKDGSPGLAVKLNSLPLNWDGSLVLLPPLARDDAGGDESK